MERRFGQAENGRKGLDEWVSAGEKAMKSNMLGVIAQIHGGRVIGDKGFVVKRSRWGDGDNSGAVALVLAKRRRWWTRRGPSLYGQINLGIFLDHFVAVSKTSKP